MFSEEINKLSEAAVKKANLLTESKSKYLVASALAGMFVGFGIILIFTIGGLLGAVNSPATKIAMGVSFGIALSLVLAAGSELFTGNNMIMPIGALEKKVKWSSVWNIWVFSYIGNVLGSVVVAALFVASGLWRGTTAEFVLKTATAKMTAPYMELFVRGILCNILVCLAVWCFFKLKDEAAKLIMVFWCLFAFITSGFEHSVANMTLLSIALMIPHKAAVSLGGFVYNLTAVTLGNIVGGMFFVGIAYWYVSKRKPEELDNKNKVA
ncbi:formate/nitrite transporter family protein [Clostridium magnum]|uniref:Nitrite transporter NirC n=1 Tax=Clostridium magnum DSM 2767 TaxID=1121326 RepID=A0A162QP14_9CLOT|nr:formate/nitrite transporter family protein [Clostridium magnum]KZL88773.1 nitrite transporter NirC [Clostridium magnum DSM 2767]SHJ50897.1 hydrosulfide channel, FNT family [Clostridium magnum DSM 2767]